MDERLLLKIIEDALKEVGCVKATKHNWILPMKEIIIVFKPRTSAWSKHFYIDLGIVLKKLHANSELRKMKVADAHLGHSLYNILLDFGEPQDYLEQLFSYDGEHHEIQRRIASIFLLFSEKIKPYLEKLNSYKYLLDNFEHKILLKPFFVYFHEPSFYIDFFRRETANET